MQPLSQVLNYLKIKEEDGISGALIQAALSTVARTAVIPMQDVLGLGSSARMNIPATQVTYCYICCPREKKSPIYKLEADAFIISLLI